MAKKDSFDFLKSDHPLRDQFEAYVRTLNPKTLFLKRHKDEQHKGKYDHPEIESMWVGYQAGYVECAKVEKANG